MTKHYSSKVGKELTFDKLAIHETLLGKREWPRIVKENADGTAKVGDDGAPELVPEKAKRPTPEQVEQVAASLVNVDNGKVRDLMQGVLDWMRDGEKTDEIVTFLEDTDF